MRISTQSMFAQEVALISQQYSTIGDLQLQIATGKEIQVGSDDPIRASRISYAQVFISDLETYQSNVTIASNRAELVDDTMQSFVAQLNDIKKTLQEAGNGSYGDSERNDLSINLSNAVSNLVSLANTQDNNGEYIFSGFSVNTMPFVNLNGNYTYQGSYGTSLIDISPSASVNFALSGFDMFGNIPTGNGTFAVSAASGNTGSAYVQGGGSVSDPATYVSDTYTVSFVTNSGGNVGIQVVGAASGQVIPPLPATVPANAPTFTPGSDIQFNGVDLHINGMPNVGDSFTVAPSQKQNLFNTLNNLVTALQTPADSSSKAMANFMQTLGTTSVAFDQIFDHVTAKQAVNGLAAKQVDSVFNINSTMIMQQTEVWSSFASADISLATTQLMQDMTGLQAAQQTYVKIQQLFLEMLKI